MTTAIITPSASTDVAATIDDLLRECARLRKDAKRTYQAAYSQYVADARERWSEMSRTGEVPRIGRHAVYSVAEAEAHANRAAAPLHRAAQLQVDAVRQQLQDAGLPPRIANRAIQWTLKGRKPLDVEALVTVWESMARRGFPAALVNAALGFELLTDEHIREGIRQERGVES
ncbi:hypothetical protein [Mycobacteroides abscessus]|uniref:hypothetical protein n=1 Tax=Mycobacteroides abscessus TaxID=36809 RepID=UPI00092C227D|nr:hypothetical protein [Mycobacteroides abscessus]SIF34925.1 Uncharacterised protein [Mycobacteroides abscessus subsp. abscessus]